MVRRFFPLPFIPSNQGRGCLGCHLFLVVVYPFFLFNYFSQFSHYFVRTSFQYFLDQAGHQAVDLIAQWSADTVDALLEKKWSRSAGKFILVEDIQAISSIQMPEQVGAACSCGSGIPARKLVIKDNRSRWLLYRLFSKISGTQGKLPGDETARELLDTVKLYNPVPVGLEKAYTATLQSGYAVFYAGKGMTN